MYSLLYSLFIYDLKFIRKYSFIIISDYLQMFVIFNNAYDVHLKNPNILNMSVLLSSNIYLITF